MQEYRLARVAGPLLVALLVGACGSDEKSSRFEVIPEPVTPTITVFDVEPATIDAGDPVTIGWQTRDVDVLALADGSGSPISLDGLSVEQGAIVVYPDATTSYTLTATGLDTGIPAVSRTITVTVRGESPDRPVVVEFEATPAEVPIGTPATLSWKTTGATQVTIKDDAGRAVDLGTAKAAEGQITVEPTRSPTAYLLTADGPGGRETAEVSVTVAGLPRVVRFDLSPSTPIDVGGSVTLSWATSNATHLVIEQDGQPLVDSTTELTSSRQVVLSDSAVFTLAAESAAGTAQARVEAKVGPRIVAFSSTERLVRARDTVNLTWQLADADRATIDGPDGYHFDINGPELISGATTWQAIQAGDLVLRAFHGDSFRTATIAIDITGAPRIRSLTVDRSRITANYDRPESVILSWAQDGADSCTIYRANVPVPGLDGFSCGATGTAEVQVINTGTLRLAARNTDGADSATVGVETIPRAKVVAFAATPHRRLTPGDSVQLSWTVVDGASVGLAKGGLSFPIDSSTVTGTADDYVLENTVYTLTARNALGYPTEAQLLVRAGDPELLSAVAEPSLVAVGDTFAVRWTADGGDLLTVAEGGGAELFRTIEPAEIDGGTATLTAPPEAGLYHYTVRVTNDVGSYGELPFELTASDGPIIRSFTTSRTGLSRGESITLAWQVRNDSDNGVPSLSLSDNRGNNYATALATTNPNNGTLTIKLDDEGEYRFTLTARTAPGRMEDTRTIAVEVTTPALLSKLTATPDRVSTVGGTVIPEVVLSWTSQDGAELEIFEANAAGEPVSDALLSLSTALGSDQALIDAGSLTVYPTATVWYLARVRNRVGSAVEKTVKVLVDPPEVTSLVVEPADIILGETAKLTWTTALASRVQVDPTPAIVTRLGNTYVDISTTGALHALTGDTMLGTIPFPSGFVFPFAGVNRTNIQVSTNGWAGFNTSNTGNVSTPGALTSANSNRYANLAVFTGDLDSTKNSSGGKLYYERYTDAIGDCFIIQWTNWSWYSSSYNPSDLNFQLVLRPNGDFEYRYGTMTSLDAGHAQGVGSSIGFQYPTSGSPGMNVVPNSTAAPGGLANTGFAFQLDLPLDGSMNVTPDVDTTYTVTAVTPDATGTAQAAVKVWKVPAITSVTLDPKAPEAGMPFSIAWATTNATRVRILGRAGTELFVTKDPKQVAAGSWTLTEPDPGVKVYTLEVINGIERNVTTRDLGIYVFDSLAIDTFAATPGEFVTAGQTVDLHWLTTGAVDVLLWACDRYSENCVEVTPANAIAADGTYTQRVNESTVFILQAYDAAGRRVDRKLGVWVGAGTLDSFAASATQLPPGGTTTLTWTSSRQQSATLEPYDPAPFEVSSATFPYIDLSSAGTGTGTARTFAGTTTCDAAREWIDFPAGFVFPFAGKFRTGIQVSIDGWAGFDRNNASNTTSPNKLGGTANTYRYVNFALFVADLDCNNSTPNGQLYYGKATDSLGEMFIIQWKNWGWYSTYNPSNLNFELVLRPNGAFEYRYGAMTATTDARASGEGVDIGFQYPTADSYGAMLVTNDTVMTGGLRNRSWRFPAGLDPNGSIAVTPTDSTTYRLCTLNDSNYRDCEEIRVLVIRPGDLLFSELMIAPTSPDAEWIELRNMTSDAIDVKGWTLSSGSGVYAIPSSVVVPPGAYAVFARSGDPTINGNLTPIAHAYGDRLTLDDAVGNAALYFGGVAVDQVAWTGAWNVPRNQSIEVDPTLMTRAPTCNDLRTAWCSAITPYGDGTFFGTPGEKAANGCAAVP